MNPGSLALSLLLGTLHAAQNSFFSDVLRTQEAASVLRRQVGFFGEDHRRIINSHDIPHRLVGRLLEDGKVVCTAFLVSEQVILTAAHCIEKEKNYVFQYNGGGAWRIPSENWEKVDVARKTLAKNYQETPTEDNIIHEDFALLLLSRRSPKGWGHLELTRTIKVGQRAMTIGFPHMLGEGRYQIEATDCSIRKLYQDSIYSDCSINRGDSGGPLLVQDKRGRWVVAGISSTQWILPDGHAAEGEPYTDDLANHFTNITLYVDRIRAAIWKMEADPVSPADSSAPTHPESR